MPAQAYREGLVALSLSFPPRVDLALHVNSTPFPRVIRITARLNVGGIARHVTWLTAGLRQFTTTLVAGRVPPGEHDMSSFVAAHDVKPVFIPEMSREISAKDIVTVYKLFRRFLAERPDIIHTHS